MALITLVVWFYAAKKYPEKGSWLLKLLPAAIFCPTSPTRPDGYSLKQPASPGW
jgi:hypothetical protein